jgi:hypothetical protein
MALAALVVGGSCTAVVTASLICASRGDCSVDPTDPANFNQLLLVNDTSSPTRAAVCDDRTCKYGIDDGTVEPQRTLETEVSWGEADAHLRLGGVGRPYRCVWFANGKKAQRQIVLHASAATTC